MAEVWAAGSTVKLVFVPWDSSYNDVVAFTSPAEQAAYFESAACSDPLVMANATYVRPNEPLTVDGPYSKVHKYNYCIVDNPVQPVEDSEPERLFYFITNCEYASPSSCRITLQLDIWQTRVVHDGCTFGQAYLERGHAALSQIKYRRETDGWTRQQCIKRYCSVPEGLDVGDTYMTGTASVTVLQSSPYIVLLSTADLTADPGTVDAPKLETARGDIVDGIPTGAQAYLLTSYGDFSSAMAWLADHSWIAQCVIGIYFIPSGMIGSLGTKTRLGGVVDAYTGFSGYFGSFTSPNPLLNGHASDFGLPPEANDEYLKMDAYPYAAYELTSFDGKSLLMKPQYVNGDGDLTFNTVGCVTPPFMRFGAYPVNYASGGRGGVSYQYTDFNGAQQTGDIQDGDYLDAALWVSDFPQFATVNNNYTTYLASNVNTREYNYQSAGWSLAASNAAANNSYDLAQRSMGTASANQAIANRLTDQQQILGVIGGGASALSSLLTGNFGGAAGSAISTGLNYLSSELSQQAGNQTFSNNQRLSSYTADANQRLAEYVNQGNYQNAIAGINAAVQDAALTPPSQVGQAGGNGFRASRGLYVMAVRVKTIAADAAKVVLQYFQRYGYAVHEWVWMPDNLADMNIMTKCTYWKMQDVPVTCATANDSEIQVIKGIFAQGVTVFSDPAVIGEWNVADNKCRVGWNLYKEV